MVRRRWLITTYALFAALAAAEEKKTPAQRQAETELLALHQQDRQAHFNHDVNALLAHAVPQLLDVRDGKTALLTPEDVRAKFTDYFRRADFSAWDDLEPPVVRVSSDGQMGWMIVRVHIAYTEREKSGSNTKHDSTAAWMAAYEKRDGNWVMTAVTSTSDEH